MQFRYRQPADAYERFAPGCFDGVIGKAVKLNFEGTVLGDATLVAAEVVEDGRAAWFTFEAPVEVLSIPGPDVLPFDVVWTEE